MTGRWTKLLAGDNRIRRILVVKWSAMGDVTIATAAMEDIANAFPGRTIDLNVHPPWQRLFQFDRRFNEVIAIDVRAQGRKVATTVEWLKRIREGHYDLIIDLQSNDHTRVLLSLLWMMGSRPEHVVGFHRRFPYTLGGSPLSSPVHAEAYAHGVLRAMGIEPRTERPVLSLSDADRRRAASLLQEHGLENGGYAVFLPGCQAAGYLKRWGAERYAKLGYRLMKTGLRRIVVLGGPDEIDECEKLKQASGPWLLNLCGKTELLDVIPICASASFIVANDTGTAHLAAATGRPMTVICGPTDPNRVKPLGSQVATVQANLPCINCYAKHCDHHSCMHLITPSMVESTLPLRRNIVSS